VTAAGCCYKVQHFGYAREIRIGKIGCEAHCDNCNCNSTPAPAPAHEPSQTATPRPLPPVYPYTTRPMTEYRLPKGPDAVGPTQGSFGKPPLTPPNPPRPMPDIGTPATKAPIPDIVSPVTRVATPVATPDSPDVTRAGATQPAGQLQVTQPTPMPPPELGPPASRDAGTDTAQMQGPVSTPPVGDND
jgi:hypothetical protein